MKCPVCNKPADVKETRTRQDGAKYRRYLCFNNHRFSTREVVVKAKEKALAQRPVQEPVYHLRQFGDVTKEQLDRYIATGDINPQPSPVKPN